MGYGCLIQRRINIKYITLKELENIKKPFFFKRSFLRTIENQNNKYLDNLRVKETILDNINGYPLDKYQSRVVLSNEEAALVVAGAGSGKSLTIIGKIVYLVKKCGIKPEEILCISFTNDATNNLRHNIEKNYNFKINIYTFHKLALEILKQNNFEYTIAPDNYLEQIVDNFFLIHIENNKYYKKALRILLGEEYTNQELLNLKRLIITFINLFKSNNHDFNYFQVILKKIKSTLNVQEYLHNKYLLLLIINIYLYYQDELTKEKALDFNDMINKAIEVLKEKKNLKKYKYIIVDEYQDTSLVTFQLLRVIINITRAKFLAVGDDFQSIYRFTGCNLQIFLDFPKYFTYGKVFKIVNTYRNPQELINVAGKFIMQNKKQQKKNLISPKHLTKPIVIYYSDNPVKALKDLLNSVPKEEIMVLGRNNKDIYRYIDNTFTQKDDIYMYNNVSFRYLTIHKSKGLEANNVILINVEDNIIGLPTKLKDEKILKYVNNTKDYYPYEEERRLFYVALTRTKNKTYIISSYDKESVFTKEIARHKGIKIIKK